MPKFVLHCQKPVAIDSPDHIQPHGTAADNSVNPLFNKKLYALLAKPSIAVLDLGCSGGGFVKTCIDDGQVGVGLEGSDYSKRHKRAEWATIPDNLFTCDITAEFKIGTKDEGDASEKTALFDVVTAWEFIEHIRTQDLPQVTRNVLRHLKPGGIWIMSVSPKEEVINGVMLHQTVQEQPWWIEFFRSQGLRHHPSLVSYFGNDWIRGPFQNGPGSFHLVLTREGEAPLDPPRTLPYSLADILRTVDIFLGYRNAYYPLQLFEEHRTDFGGNVQFHLTHARLLKALNMPADAANAAARALSADPKNSEARQLLVRSSPAVTQAKHPKISVITPSFNCGPFLDRMIQSVTSQNYDNFEHIVMDAGSKDQTVEVLKKYSHLNWASEPDKGEGDALNKALKKVTGDIILWLNADDWIEPAVFHRVADEMDIEKGIHCCFGKTNMVDGEGRFLWLKQSEPKMNLPLLLRWWANGQHPHQPSCYYSRKMVEDLGPFNSSLHYSLDYEYWLRIMARYKFLHVDMIMSAMRNREDSKSIVSVPAQITSHWRVGLPYQQYLTSDQRLTFWSEYYGFLFSNGPHTVFGDQPVIPPTTREAQIALAAVLQKIPDASKSQLFAGWVAERSDEPVSRELGRLARDSVVAPSIPAGLRKPADDLPHPRIIIDGMFFQFFQTGIARVWTSLLNQWLADGFAKHLIVLDRAGTMSRIEGIRYRTIAPYDYDNVEADRRMLQRICDEEKASVFVSTYYTTPITTPSVFMAHDMIPELFGWELRQPMWREKHFAIRHAAAFVSVSQSTKRDLLKYFPDLSPERIAVTPLAAVAAFTPRPKSEIDAFRAATATTRPYFLTVGARGGYKNTILTFRALAAFKELDQFDLICAGQVTLEPEFQQLLPHKQVKAYNLTDDELAAAYSGAVALLHPSTYEGFGLPVLEALACGCPVITTKNGSLAEVADDAALFVKDDDVQGIVNALREIQKEQLRTRLQAAGIEHAKNFSWQKTADQLREVLLTQCAEKSPR